MDSHEILKSSIQPVGVKVVAAEMRLSASLVYKWCQELDDDSGAANPLDRLKKLMEVTGDDSPLQWLCQQFGGFYVANPSPNKSDQNQPALVATQSLLREFSDILAAVSGSLADDNRIAPAEAVNIRTEWEELKALAESFVVACEAGFYNPAE